MKKRKKTNNRQKRKKIVHIKPLNILNKEEMDEIYGGLKMAICMPGGDGPGNPGGGGSCDSQHQYTCSDPHLLVPPSICGSPCPNNNAGSYVTCSGSNCPNNNTGPDCGPAGCGNSQIGTCYCDNLHSSCTAGCATYNPWSIGIG